MIRDNWEIRASKLAVPSYILARIDVADALLNHISGDEWVRLNRKMKLVEQQAKLLGAAMIKGTLKYEHDDIEQAEWLEHMKSELLDLVNYTALMEASK